MCHVSLATSPQIYAASAARKVIRGLVMQLKTIYCLCQFSNFRKTLLNQKSPFLSVKKLYGGDDKRTSRLVLSTSFTEVYNAVYVLSSTHREVIRPLLIHHLSVSPHIIHENSKLCTHTPSFAGVAVTQLFKSLIN